MQMQTTKTRRSVVELDRARRSLPSGRPAGLDMLRLGDRKAPAAGDTATMTEIFSRAVKGHEGRHWPFISSRKALD
ncbi:hypothetical protein [uncultured Nisaea sp.]|uniref:hypothetical protein n=1 Tax=uncultured Nisaea sp. TaxID=538215 RepID=UPI0030EEB225